jgi:uncharacterized damage-inducible protein DinB
MASSHGWLRASAVPYPTIAAMISDRTARRLTRYNAWANRTIFDAVAGLPAGEATKERPTLFKNMVNTLNHLYAVDLIWRAHLEGRSHDIPALNTVLHADLNDLQRAQAVIDQWYIDWYDALPAAALAQQVHFTLIGGKAGVMTRGEILFHVVNHTSYHRGFVADLFFQVPLRPPLTDLPIFLREHPDAVPL